MRLGFVGFFLATLLAAACATATSYGPRPLEIRSEGGQVLGCISHDEGEEVVVELAGVSSQRVNGERAASPWGIAVANGAGMLHLAPGECLRLGDLPEGYSSVEQGAELRDEWPYSFAIRAPERGQFRTRNYSGNFCVRQTAGRLQVVNVPKEAGVITVETCRGLLDAASGADDSEPRPGR